MAEDLLTRIQRELQERIEELHCAVQERDRLQAELRALDVATEPPVARNVDPEPSLESEPPSDSKPLSEPEPPLRPALAAVPDVTPEPSAAVLCFPATRDPARAPTTPPATDRPIPAPARPLRRHVVSPKVARLMLAPRRPALERPGIARVGARAGRVDVSSRELVDEADSDAELFERSL